ncbi:NUDIX domain-containing protein [Psychrobacillus sp. PGGUH221]|uniref:NUDIX domain-containing protein n=1 Tax=Psychrobacillus sp. PGGUH221 TaxID=3020058 RepID=UPI0035C77A27
METKINIKEVTSQQPFCAGVIITKEDKILVTLNTDGLPKNLKGISLRVGGVGGGQEPDENILECAIREAKEEICVDVEIMPSKSTFFHNIDESKIEEIDVKDEIPPLLFERVSNPRPNVPFKEGLPIGPYIYFGLYEAKLNNWDEIKAGDDVQGLLLLPIKEWNSLLDGNCTIADVKNRGAELIHNNLDESTKLWVSPQESFGTVSKLLLKRNQLMGF